LLAFQGPNCVKLINYNDDEQSLTLEKLQGPTLKSFFKSKEEAHSIDIAQELISKLHAQTFNLKEFPSFEKLFKALDTPLDIPQEHAKRAQIAIKPILNSPLNRVLLHGDLHHENIMQHKGNWVMIDPQGYVGEAAFEACPFIRNPIPEIGNHKDLIAARIKNFANFFGISMQRMLCMFYATTIVGCIWQREENFDASLWLNLCDQVLPLLQTADT
jgi:streptomycin 6-kinase